MSNTHSRISTGICWRQFRISATLCQPTPIEIFCFQVVSAIALNFLDRRNYFKYPSTSVYLKKNHFAEMCGQKKIKLNDPRTDKTKQRTKRSELREKTEHEDEKILLWRCAKRWWLWLEREREKLRVHNLTWCRLHFDDIHSQHSTLKQWNSLHRVTNSFEA